MVKGKSTIIEKQSGDAFYLKKGELVKVTTPQGEQVADLMLFNAEDVDEHLSNGKTFDFEETIHLTTGNHLWSNRSHRMMKIIEDTCGKNDFLLAPCSQKTFEIIYNDYSDHPSCFSNLYKHLKPFGIAPDQIGTAFNIFMNVPVKEDGRLSVERPTAKPGDYVLFQAEMNLLVGLTACSAEQTNNNSFSEIIYEVISPQSV